MMETYAYIRVSTKEQNIDRQLMAIAGYEIPKKNIYCDRQSGKDFNRPKYKRMVGKLKEGDLLIVKSIDRLGRNYNEILIQWQHITKDIGADIKVLDMELLDTRKKDGNLTGTLIADLVLQIFAYMAQKEREFILSRQAEGIAAAKARGIRLGRKIIQMPDGFETECEKCMEGKLTTREAAERIGIVDPTNIVLYSIWEDEVKEEELKAEEVQAEEEIINDIEAEDAEIKEEELKAEEIKEEVIAEEAKEEVAEGEDEAKEATAEPEGAVSEDTVEPEGAEAEETAEPEGIKEEKTEEPEGAKEE